MIFLSYSHQETAYANRIEQYLRQHHMPVLRDIHDEEISDSIAQFIRRVNQSDYVILLISDAYLKSYYCVNEALIAYSQREKRHIIPILCMDVQNMSSECIVSYITYWSHERNVRIMQIERSPSLATIKLQEELRQIEAYVNYLGDFLSYIKDTICLLQKDGEDALKQLYSCLCQKILSREIRDHGIECIAKECNWKPEGKDPVLTIDFGTSYTLASVVDGEGNVHMIPGSNGSKILRSTIEFMQNGDYRIGTNGSNAVRHIKRYIGVSDYIEIGNKKWSVTLLVAMILRSVIKNAEEYLGIKIKRIMMSLPTDFSLLQKKIMTESARIAGVKVRRFVQESSVEAYLSSAEGHHHVAFIDMGGGTLDISLVESEPDIHEVVYVDGDSTFGSLDFDREMERLLEKKLLKEYGITANGLGVLAEQAKCQLGEQETVSVTYLHNDQYGDVRTIPLKVTRGEFEEFAQNCILRFQEALSRLRNHVQSWKLEAPFTTIYLTGQGTKMFALKKIIAQTFPNQKIVDCYQESAVIRGLSVMNQFLSGHQESGVLLGAIPSGIIVRCKRIESAEKDKPDYVLSHDGELVDHKLLDTSITIPNRKSCLIGFDDLQRETKRGYPLVMCEITASGRRNTLIDTVLVASKDEQCEITVDVDADYCISITVRSYPSGELMYQCNF